MHNALIIEGVFPSVINALHTQSDVGHHPHPQVIMAYLELTVRYARTSTNEALSIAVSLMVGTQGLRHKDPQVRSRSAYLFFRLTEALAVEGRAAMLLPCIGSFGDLILSSAATPQQANAGTMLSEQEELYVLEAVGLMTSAVHTPASPSDVGTAAAGGSLTTSTKQTQLLSDMVSHLRSQILTIASHPERAQYAHELGCLVAHKISSLGALAKGHSYKRAVGAYGSPQSSGCGGSAVQFFAPAVDDVAVVVNLFGPTEVCKPFYSENKFSILLHIYINCTNFVVFHTLASIPLIHYF